MAELCGRETGYCHGKGGSMHITDTEIGVLGANGIVGGGFTLDVYKRQPVGGAYDWHLGDGEIFLENV